MDENLCRMRTLLVPIVLVCAAAAAVVAIAWPQQAVSNGPASLSNGGESSNGQVPDVAIPAAPAGGVLRLSSIAARAMGPGKFASAGCGVGSRPGDTVETLVWSGGERAYRVHIPAGYSPLRPAPLVLNFHGYGRTAEHHEAYSGLVPFSDRDGFVLVTPEGSGSPQGWNVVGVYSENGVDDLQFTSELVAAIEATLCIDAARVYATGLSNGAEMASQVACRLSDVFAAVAPVAGAVYQGCDGEPVPMIAFQGTDDWNVFYEWSAGGVSGWAVHNGCLADVDVTSLSDHVLSEAYAGCNGNDVVFVIVDGGGHTWPGAEDDAGGVGPTTHEISANELIWQFFADHPKDG